LPQSHPLLTPGNGHLPPHGGGLHPRLRLLQHPERQAPGPGSPGAQGNRRAGGGAHLALRRAHQREPDDLPDGGATHFANTILAIHRRNPGVAVEVLVPDFMGDLDAVARVVAAGPAVFNHNTETVPSLYPEVRPRAG